MKGVDFVNISRSDSIGPAFRVSSFTFFQTPERETLKNKFKKNYVTNNPIELLAYIDWDLDSDENQNYPEDHWKNIVKDIEVPFKQSHFRKLWIYNSALDHILYEFENSSKVIAP